MSDLKYKGYNADTWHDDRMKFCNTELNELPLAMAYVPMQQWGEVYTESDALKRGTLFPELDKPFYGKFTGAKRNG